MKKVLSIVVAVITSVTLLAGCGKKEVVKTSLKFGTLPAESAIPIIVAKEKGFFEKEGLDMELVAFNSPNDRNIAVQAGKIDGTIADVMTSLTFHEAGFPMKITSDINEDFKLLTSPNSNIDSFEKLNNKDVSIVPNFVLEYIMDEIAARNNIKYNVVVIPSISARFEALLQDKVNAVVFTEPQATLLESQGAKVIASSKEYGIKAGTFLFNEKIIKEDPKAVKAFYKAYNEAVEYINKTNPSEYSEVLSNYSFPPIVTKYLSGEAKYIKAGKIDNETFESVLKWSKSKGLVKKDYKFEDVSNFKFIE
ncbi:ABC transporter substrate-binding protein [Clostridium amazonitimonense]|uniref:ABC transporter substrate-binding protein n=1 Tax=Clostridium amazonitimonense TaxID=1499689 RepID=UPI0005099CF1|nr:ABC transporter substrate-binding protein [Clostridium amazonitimonense]